MQTVVQVIETIWSRASRGAPGAVARNAVPERVAVPDLALADAVVLQHVVFPERQGFARMPDGGVVPFAKHHSTRFALAIEPGEGGAGIAFFGFEFRRASTKPQTTLLLATNCWMQIIANYRVVEESSWTYRKLAINVFYGPRHRADELMASKAPVSRIDHQKHLR